MGRPDRLSLKGSDTTAQGFAVGYHIAAFQATNLFRLDDGPAAVMAAV
jgi:hypothetical protein